MDTGTIKVFLLEDDPDDVFLIGELLKQAGPETKIKLEGAGYLAAALKRLGTEKFDVVLLDLNLPDSRGLETYLRLRARGLRAPVVVLTGLSDEAMAYEALRHGAQDYLVKGTIDARSLMRSLRYALERSRLLASLEGVLESALDAMVVVDREGIARYANPAAAAFFGRAREAMLGSPFEPAVSPGKTSDIKVALPSGEERVGEMRVTAVDWGGQQACLATIRDIGPLRQLEQLRAEIKERRKLDQLKDQFVSSVSHELRTPLTVIKGAMENLKEGLAGALNGPQAQAVELAFRNVHRLEKMVLNILDLSRLESGQARMNPRRLGLSSLVQDVTEEFRLIEPDHRLEIRSDVPLQLPEVVGDRDMLSGVLGNLVENACRFAKSAVTVRVRAVDGSPGAHLAQGVGTGTAVGVRAIQVTVEDDGPGIPKAKLGELFNKFVQISRPAGGGYKGTGLGLAICKEVLALHHGEIWIESDTGLGTQVHFVLPVAGA